MPDAAPATAAQIAATRHLIGLSQAELAEALGVNRHAVKDWESGRFSARLGVVADLEALRAKHDGDLQRMIALAGQGGEATTLSASGARPRGWYLALGARLLDRDPSARVDWSSTMR